MGVKKGHLSTMAANTNSLMRNEIGNSTSRMKNDKEQPQKRLIKNNLMG